MVQPSKTGGSNLEMWKMRKGNCICQMKWDPDIDIASNGITDFSHNLSWTAIRTMKTIYIEVVDKDFTSQ